MSFDLFDGFTISQLNESHVQSLVTLRVPEDERLDYKLDVLLTTESERKAFCKDVAAFANTRGGYLVIGIEESESRAAKAVGVDSVKGDEERLRQVITNGISPHVQSIEIQKVSLNEGKIVIVVRIGHDGRLHQVQYGDSRFYRRNGNTTTIMDAADIASFHDGNPVLTREDEIHEERKEFENNLRGNRFYGMRYDGGIMSVAIIPRNPIRLKIFHDRDRIVTGFPPIYCSGWDIQFRQRSVTTSGQFPGEKSPHAITEIDNTGRVFAAESFMLSRDGSRVRSHATVSEYFVPSIAFEREIITSVYKYISTLKLLESAPPWYVGISLLNVRGFAMYVDPWRTSNSLRQYDGDDISTELVVIEAGISKLERQDIAKLLRPSFDEIWRAFGFARSFNYDDDSGEWKPQ